MPGRGTPWRGVGKGKQDRIGSGEIEDDSLLSEDIKDGTIKEIDLDTALQAKVNAVGGGGHTIQDEGTPLTQRTNLNFVGTGVVASDGIEDTTTVTIAGPDGVGYDTVDEEGTPLTKRSTLRFIGEPVTAQDSESTTTITVFPPQIQDEGVNLNAKRNTIDYVGAGVVATDGPGNKTTITIAGGGASFNPLTDIIINDVAWFYDEFFYPDPVFGSPNFHFEGVANTFVAQNSTINGVVRTTTTTVINNIARLNLCASGLTAIDVTKNFRNTWRLTIDTNVSLTALFCGFTPEAQFPSGAFPFASRPTPYIGFFWNGSGNILAQTHNGVTPNSTDTGVAMTQIPHVYDITFDGTTMLFFIDAVQVASFTTNLPSGNLSAIATHQTGTAGLSGLQYDSFLIANSR